MPDTPTAAQRAAAEMNRKRAMVQLAIKHSFFSTLLMNARVTLDDNIATACVNAQGHIRLGTIFAAEHLVPQLVTALAHEVMHPALDHFSRMMGRDPRAWNIAGDKVINAILAASGLEPIPDWIFQAGADAFSAEELYQEDDGQGIGQGIGQGSGQGGKYSPGTGFDDLDQTPMDPAQAAHSRAEWKVNVAKAKAVAKQAGQMSGELERLVDSIIYPTTPWFELLERWMQGFVRADYNWKRPSKRYLDAGLYLPSAGKQPSMGTLVIQSDESGSITEKQQQHFAGHISKIIETCQPEQVIILHTDTEVHRNVEELTVDDLPLQFKTYACGGTDMRAGITWVEEHGIEPDAFVTLTDGYTPWPKYDPGFPLMWLITSERVAPVGETIHYKVED